MIYRFFSNPVNIPLNPLFPLALKKPTGLVRREIEESRLVWLDTKIDLKKGAKELKDDARAKRDRTMVDLAIYIRWRSRGSPGLKKIGFRASESDQGFSVDPFDFTFCRHGPRWILHSKECCLQLGFFPSNQKGQMEAYEAGTRLAWPKVSETQPTQSASLLSNRLEFFIVSRLYHKPGTGNGGNSIRSYCLGHAMDI